jgi:DNA invertase Pin-like site-specific DNA recombinase
MLKATGQPIDTTSAAGKAFLVMLGVFADFETSLRRERQVEGIKAAKAPGHLQRLQRAAVVDQAGGALTGKLLGAPVGAT